jgi:hypothetical protein
MIYPRSTSVSSPGWPTPAKAGIGVPWSLARGCGFVILDAGAELRRTVFSFSRTLSIGELPAL